MQTDNEGWISGGTNLLKCSVIYLVKVALYNLDTRQILL